MRHYRKHRGNGRTPNQVEIMGTVEAMLNLIAFMGK